MKDDPLVGKCFVIFGKDGQWNYQGRVVDGLGDGRYMIQFFDALMGYPSTYAVAHIDMMTLRLGRPEGAWEFFENDEHLRNWIGDTE